MFLSRFESSAFRVCLKLSSSMLEKGRQISVHLSHAHFILFSWFIWNLLIVVLVHLDDKTLNSRYIWLSLYVVVWIGYSCHIYLFSYSRWYFTKILVTVLFFSDSQSQIKWISSCFFSRMHIEIIFLIRYENINSFRFLYHLIHFHKKVYTIRFVWRTTWFT